MAEIRIAQTAGFCFGVERAVSLCHRLLDEGRTIVTLGEIIHNANAVQELKQRGCHVVRSPFDTPLGATLVIRSHGVSSDVLAMCRRENIKVTDATCPFVAKIHHIVEQYSREDVATLIAGDRGHPEVIGIVGHARGPVYVFEDAEQLAELSHKIGASPCIMVAQTTFNHHQYTQIAGIAKNLCTNIQIFDTICGATRDRQQEAESLAQHCDVCVVIGGKNSSNTKQLYDVCAKYTKTYRVETAGELAPGLFDGATSVGITAGASTPAPIIQEVANAVSDLINEEFDFEQALEESLKLVRRGQRVEGVVTSIRPNEIVVDIGTKHTGFIPLDELSDDPSAKPEDIVKVGDSLRLLVIKVQDLEGVVTLSKKRMDSEAGLSDLAKGMEEGAIFEAFITEAVEKGLVAMVKGIRVFIPASQATLRRGEPFDQLVRTKQQIKILEVTPERRRAIGSIRAVLDASHEQERAQFWKTLEVGQRFHGTVKSLTDYGAFVDLGPVDGMVHKSELSWDRVAKPQDFVKIGDEIDVYVKEFNPQTRKISLGYRDEAQNPWNNLKDIPLGSEFEAPVVSITAFGAFVRILPGIDGLVHTSELSELPVKHPGEVVKVGQVVKVRLIGVDHERKRISLSMREPEPEFVPVGDDALVVPQPEISPEPGPAPVGDDALVAPQSEISPEPEPAPAPKKSARGRKATAAEPETEPETGVLKKITRSRKSKAEPENKTGEGTPQE